ncbi:MAG: polysaccharide deacetylase family protein [Coriobacteriales bacterium]|jgi:peptidoglycan/xylan/chitin deacetylase (PgdA/CDA1 family)|nr:polysaccharide deacetylase family protein [Coriobacteriales bacterium]
MSKLTDNLGDSFVETADLDADQSGEQNAAATDTVEQNAAALDAEGLDATVIDTVEQNAAASNTEDADTAVADTDEQAATASETGEQDTATADTDEQNTSAAVVSDPTLLQIADILTEFSDTRSRWTDQETLAEPEIDPEIQAFHEFIKSLELEQAASELQEPFDQYDETVEFIGQSGQLVDQFGNTIDGSDEQLAQNLQDTAAILADDQYQSGTGYPAGPDARSVKPSDAEYSRLKAWRAERYGGSNRRLERGARRQADTTSQQAYPYRQSLEPAPIASASSYDSDPTLYESSVASARPASMLRQSTVDQQALPGRKPISRRAFIGATALAGTALVAGTLFVLNRISALGWFDPNNPDSSFGLPNLGEFRLDEFIAPGQKYARGLWLDSKKLLFGQLGETQQLRAAAGQNHAILDEADFFSSDESIATVDTFGLVTAQGFGSCEVGVGAGEHIITCKVQVAERWAALTFDDGPMESTRVLLDGLRERGVQVTFFVVGNMAEGKPDILQQMLTDGHEIGNHTYNHQGSPDVLENQLSRTDEIVRNATGFTPTMMRPPGGFIYDITKNCGKSVIMWSVDPKDWLHRDTDVDFENVMSGRYSGSIILLHDIYSPSVEAGLWVIDAMTAEGYAFVTVGELLNHPLAGEVYYEGPETPRAIKWMNDAWAAEIQPTLLN